MPKDDSARTNVWMHGASPNEVHPHILYLSLLDLFLPTTFLIVKPSVVLEP